MFIDLWFAIENPISSFHNTDLGIRFPNYFEWFWLSNIHLRLFSFRSWPQFPNCHRMTSPVRSRLNVASRFFLLYFPLLITNFYLDMAIYFHYLNNLVDLEIVSMIIDSWIKWSCKRTFTGKWRGFTEFNLLKVTRLISEEPKTNSNVQTKCCYTFSSILAIRN